MVSRSVMRAPRRAKSCWLSASQPEASDEGSTGLLCPPGQIEQPQLRLIRLHYRRSVVFHVTMYERFSQNTHRVCRVRSKMGMTCYSSQYFDHWHDLFALWLQRCFGFFSTYSCHLTTSFQCHGCTMSCDGSEAPHRLVHCTDRTATTHPSMLSSVDTSRWPQPGETYCPVGQHVLGALIARKDKPVGVAMVAVLMTELVVRSESPRVHLHGTTVRNPIVNERMEKDRRTCLQPH